MSTGTTPTLLQSTVLGGSAAVFAVNFTHPIELVKSRVQVNNLGVIQTCSQTLKNEGMAAFWKVRIEWSWVRFRCEWGFISSASNSTRIRNRECSNFDHFLTPTIILFLFFFRDFHGPTAEKEGKLS